MKDISVQMRTVCWDIKPGHRLALGLDLASVMYKSANSALDLRLTVSVAGASELLLSLVQQ